jgi:hypothetical protein
MIERVALARGSVFECKRGIGRILLSVEEDVYERVYITRYLADLRFGC